MARSFITALLTPLLRLLSCSVAEFHYAAVGIVWHIPLYTYCATRAAISRAVLSPLHSVHRSLRRTLARTPPHHTHSFKSDFDASLLFLAVLSRFLVFRRETCSDRLASPSRKITQTASYSEALFSGPSSFRCSSTVGGECLRYVILDYLEVGVPNPVCSIFVACCCIAQALFFLLHTLTGPVSRQLGRPSFIQPDTPRSCGGPIPPISFCANVIHHQQLVYARMISVEKHGIPHPSFMYSAPTVLPDSGVCYLHGDDWEATKILAKCP